MTEPRYEMRDGIQYAPDLCADCDPVATFGLCHSDDPHFIPGDFQYVDKKGIAHDPIVHARGCPKAVAVPKPLPGQLDIDGRVAS